MAMALCDGWLETNTLNGHQMFACANNFSKLQDNCKKRGIQPCHDSFEVVQNSDVIILAVKPYMIEDVVKPIRHKLGEKIVVSVAACYNYEKYINIFDKGTHFISTIPNTPVSVGEGVIVCENKHTLTESQLTLFEQLFQSIALVECVGTHQLSVAGTISGCGPAFVNMFIEALGDAGVKYGLTRDMAYRLASQMIVGTGKMQMVTQKHPGTLKDAVCSPGGTTIKGVTKLEEEGFRNAVIKAIDAIEG